MACYLAGCDGSDFFSAPGFTGSAPMFFEVFALPFASSARDFGALVARPLPSGAGGREQPAVPITTLTHRVRTTFFISALVVSCRPECPNLSLEAARCPAARMTAGRFANR
jgi:hypothetical protein